ncbi:hypothetical protein KCU90_g249, partial [Aureobasidium melanogenum]
MRNPVSLPPLRSLSACAFYEVGNLTSRSRLSGDSLWFIGPGPRFMNNVLLSRLACLLMGFPSCVARLPFDPGYLSLCHYRAEKSLLGFCRGDLTLSGVTPESGVSAGYGVTGVVIYEGSRYVECWCKDNTNCCGVSES